MLETKDRDKAYQAAESVKRNFYRNLAKLCNLADVEYKGAHAFRHSNAHYCIKNARTPEQLKAISQNLMHKSTKITDEIYSRMNAGDTNEIITKLGVNEPSPVSESRPAIPFAEILASMTFEEKKKLLGL